MNASKDEPEENYDVVTFVRSFKYWKQSRIGWLQALAANLQIKQKSMRYVSWEFTNNLTGIE